MEKGANIEAKAILDQSLDLLQNRCKNADYINNPYLTTNT